MARRPGSPRKASLWGLVSDLPKSPPGVLCPARGSGRAGTALFMGTAGRRVGRLPTGGPGKTEARRGQGSVRGCGSEAGARKPRAQGAGEGPVPTLPGPPSSSAHWKQEPVIGKPERRERKQTESEKSLELEALGLFGLAETPPGPLPAALHRLRPPSHTHAHTRARARAHGCTQARRHTQTHTRHGHIHTCTHLVRQLRLEGRC